MKKIIGIFVSVILVITSLSVTAFVADKKLEQNGIFLNDNFFDQPALSNFIVDPCISPDNGYGTVDLPADCPYIATGDPLQILNGLPSGTTIELDPVLDDFLSIVRIPGGPLGGEVLQFDASLILDISGTGDLTGFNRNINVPVSIIINTGPRTPGNPVQTFASEIFQLSGVIYGDPDFCTLEITVGTNYGLPSPGQYILTQLPSGDFNIDSFFDITYQIEFEGCPGSILEGMSGTTIDTIRIQQGTETTNNPPNSPSQLSGPSSGIVHDTISYTSSATDPDGDNVKYGIDFHNDGVIDDWTEYYPSGVTITFHITFNTIGTYQLRLKAEDTHGAESGWSTTKTVIITEEINNPPNKPDTPTGETDGKTGTSYSYSSSTTDPDEDLVWYQWDWGDGNFSEWLGPFSSGIAITTYHNWNEDGNYEIKVKAKDQHEESPWSDPLSVSMPKSKTNIPLGLIFVFGFDVDVKIVQLPPGEDYTDLEVLDKPFYIWENEIQTRNPGEFIRLYNAKGLFSPSFSFCFGICNDWGIIG